MSDFTESERGEKRNYSSLTPNYFAGIVSRQKRSLKPQKRSGEEKSHLRSGHIKGRFVGPIPKPQGYSTVFNKSNMGTEGIACRNIRKRRHYTGSRRINGGNALICIDSPC